MKYNILWFILILTCLCGLIILIGAAIINYLIKPNGRIISSGENRTYLIYVPTTYNPATPTPLVISLHGFASWPAHQMKMSHWNDLAEKHGFIVVYPSGTGFPRRWRTGGSAGTANDSMRDVVFIADLIDKLEAEYNIDPNRIFANGLSNGGGMSFMLACKLADRIAAIGGVSGAYQLPWSECKPGHPVPIIVFHGTDDAIVPYAGGIVSPLHFTLPAIPDWVTGWARHNGCTDQPLELPTTGEVSGIRYASCNQNADVVFYTIHGGGHAWPGGGLLPKMIVGHTTQDIDATRIMWEFFIEHPLE